MTPVIEHGPWQLAVRLDDDRGVYEISEWLVWSGAATGSCPDYQPVRASVEIRRSGGVAPRALVGGCLRRAEGTSLRVATSSTLTLGADTSCPSSLSKALVPGLPPEFAEAVLKGLIDASLGSVICGDLTVDRSGYDEVESSPIAFKRAAGLLHGVLAARAGQRDALEEVRALMARW